MIRYLESFSVLFRWYVVGIIHKNDNILAKLWGFVEDLLPVFKGNWLFPIFCITFLFSTCISAVAIYRCKKSGRKIAGCVSILSLVMNIMAILSTLLLFALSIAFYKKIVVQMRFFRGFGNSNLVETLVIIVCYYVMIWFFLAIVFAFINILFCVIAGSPRTAAPLTTANMPASMSANMPASMSANIPANVSANMQTSMSAHMPPLTPVCPQCGKPITANMQFCANCGSKVNLP